jgi:hypothetical protein
MAYDYELKKDQELLCVESILCGSNLFVVLEIGPWKPVTKPTAYPVAQHNTASPQTCLDSHGTNSFTFNTHSTLIPLASSIITCCKSK